MAQSSAVTSGDLATSTQFNNLRNDILSTTLGHVHDGTNGRSTSAGVGLVAQNTTDAASNQVGEFGGGNRGTPADNDEGYFSFELDNDAGTQTEFVRFTWKALDVSNSSKDSRPELQYYTGNTLRELAFPAITADDTVVVTTLAQTLANKTLTAPTIVDFSNAAHDHGDADDGGTVVTSSETVQGIIELATQAEVSGGIEHEKAITPDKLAGSDVLGGRAIQVLVFDVGTDVATGNNKFLFHVDQRLAGMNIVDVHALVSTNGTTGTTDIQLFNITSSQDILSTKLTIDSGETGSDTAATPVVIDGGQDDLTLNDRIQIDIDAVSATAPKGLVITIGCRLP